MNAAAPFEAAAVAASAATVVVAAAAVVTAAAAAVVAAVVTIEAALEQLSALILIKDRWRVERQTRNPPNDVSLVIKGKREKNIEKQIRRKEKQTK